MKKYVIIVLSAQAMAGITAFDDQEDKIEKAALLGGAITGAAGFLERADKVQSQMQYYDDIQKKQHALHDLVAPSITNDSLGNITQTLGQTSKDLQQTQDAIAAKVTAYQNDRSTVYTYGQKKLSKEGLFQEYLKTKQEVDSLQRVLSDLGQGSAPEDLKSLLQPLQDGGIVKNIETLTTSDMGMIKDTLSKKVEVRSKNLKALSSTFSDILDDIKKQEALMASIERVRKKLPDNLLKKAKDILPHLSENSTYDDILQAVRAQADEYLAMRPTKTKGLLGSIKSFVTGGLSEKQRQAVIKALNENHKKIFTL